MINIKLVLTSNYACLKLSTKIIIIAYFIYQCQGLQHHPSFYPSLFFVHFIYHHWDAILGLFKLNPQFVWLLIIGKPFQVLLKLNRLFLRFLIIGTPSLVLSQIILCSFCFLSLGHHPRLYKLNCLILWILVIGTQSQVLSKFILWSFNFLSVGCHPRFYLTLVHLLSHHWDTLLGFI